MALQAIEFINFNSGVLLNGSKGINTAPVIAISILIIPLIDTLRVFMIRMLNKKSPFHPDKNHIHHRLLDLGLSHAKITIIMIIANLIFVLLAFHMKDTGIDKFILLIVSLALFVSSVPFLIKTKEERLIEKSSEIPVIKMSTNKGGSDGENNKKVNG